MDAVRVKTDTVWDFDDFPISQAVVEPAGRRVHVSGQVGWTPNLEVVGIGDAGAQADYAIDNIERVLAEVGGTLNDVVALTMYYCRDEDKDAIIAVRQKRFDLAHGPASTGIRVAGFVDADLLVEITVIAVVPEHRFKG